MIIFPQFYLEDHSLGVSIRVGYREGEGLIKHRIVIFLDDLGLNNFMTSRQKMDLDIGISLPSQDISLLQIL